MSKRLADLSLWGVIASNLLSIAMAIFQGWDLSEIMWIYWIQSVVIGIINFIRIRTLKEFCTKNFKMNDKPVSETAQSRNQVAYFFLFHYGFFHVGYAVFLWQQLAITEVDFDTLLFLLLCACGFLGAHSFSFAHNLKRDFKEKKPNIGTLMFYPYMRIIPMHLVIVMGDMMGGGALYIFLLLKTFADAIMHMIEHHLFQKPEREVI